MGPERDSGCNTITKKRTSTGRVAPPPQKSPPRGSGKLFGVFRKKEQSAPAKARGIRAPSTFTGADYQPGPQAGILRSRMKERCKKLPRLSLKSYAIIRRKPKNQCAMARARARQHVWERAATLPMVRLSVPDVCISSLVTCRHVVVHDEHMAFMLVTVSIQ